MALGRPDRAVVRQRTAKIGHSPFGGAGGGWCFQPYQPYTLNGVAPSVTNGLVYRNVGNKYYELKDHLGNVRVVVSDRKNLNTSDNSLTAHVVSYNNYYPFGMPQPSRNFDSQEYRYGFNGMEKDDELKGGANSYDFGARMQDPRIGRWLSIDPKYQNYPAVSPYTFALNSPLMFKDPNGEDAIVTVVKDSKGGGKIIIKSTVYITGHSTSESRAIDLTNDAAVFLRDGSYTDDQGNTWEISYDVKFEFVEDKSSIKLGKGENLLDFTSEKVRSSISAKRREYKKGGVVTKIEETTGTTGIIGNKGDDLLGEIKQNSTVIHELLHLLGLSDRYVDVKDPSTGKNKSVPNENFEEDIMGNTSTPNLSQTHFDNIGAAFANKKSGDYLMNLKVDVDKKGNLIGKGYRAMVFPVKTISKGVDTGTSLSPEILNEKKKG